MAVCSPAGAAGMEHLPAAGRPTRVGMPAPPPYCGTLAPGRGRRLSETSAFARRAVHLIWKSAICVTGSAPAVKPSAYVPVPSPVVFKLKM